MKNQAKMFSMKNQAQVFDHLKLSADEAYQLSYVNSDNIAMQRVLKAHKKHHSVTDAKLQIKVARNFEKLDV
jgi:hypothetical protein